MKISSRDMSKKAMQRVAKTWAETILEAVGQTVGKIGGGILGEMASPGNEMAEKAGEIAGGAIGTSVGNEAAEVLNKLIHRHKNNQLPQNVSMALEKAIQNNPKESYTGDRESAEAYAFYKAVIKKAAEEQAQQPEHLDVKQVASKMKFLPTSKKALKYSFVKDGVPGKMPAMSYTVSSKEQPVVTNTADGKETQNVAAEGDIIMSGPSQENYVLKAAKFPKLYQGKMGEVVIPEQSPRQVALYTGNQPITFTAAWGESMILKPGDYLVQESDGQNYYRIAKHEYEQTYNQPGKTGSVYRSEIITRASSR
jgi:hypothetical protein